MSQFVVNEFSYDSSAHVTGSVALQQQSRRKQVKSAPCEMSKKKNKIRERLQKKLKAKKDAKK